MITKSKFTVLKSIRPQHWTACCPPRR